MGCLQSRYCHQLCICFNKIDRFHDLFLIDNFVLNISLLYFDFIVSFAFGCFIVSCKMT